MGDVAQLKTLGTFEVRLEGRSIRTGDLTPGAAALIKRLSLAPSARLHCDQVIADLWPDLSPSQAALALYETVAEAGQGLGSDDAVVLSGDTVVMLPEHSLEVDADRFLSLAEGAILDGDPQRAAAIAELYTGEYLPEDRNLGWAVDARRRVRRAFENLTAVAEDGSAGPGSEVPLSWPVVPVLDQPRPRAGPISYASSGDYSIAYQVIGDGPIDLVFVPGFISHIELMAECPPLVAMVQRLASIARLIVFDKRGTGLSDRMPADRPATMEERMDDVRAVMDAAGSQRASILGVSEGGPMSILFAASYPERVEKLVLVNTFASPQGIEYLEAAGDIVSELWGRGTTFQFLSGHTHLDHEVGTFFSRIERNSATPATARHYVELMFDIDVTSALASVAAPTLVLHRSEDVAIPVELGREVAAGIPGAVFSEHPGAEHLFFMGEVHELLLSIEEFVSGEVPAPTAAPDRRLATVLFVDIVDSTATAVAMQDQAWVAMFKRFYEVASEAVDRHGGQVIKSTGDGLLAVFDGTARGVRCGCEMLDAVTALGLSARIGLHTGEIEMLGDDIAGIGVHIGSRVASAAEADEVWVSRTVTDLVAGSGLNFSSRGEHTLKGLDEPWALYAVER